MRTNSKEVKTQIREYVLEQFSKDSGWDTDDKLANLKEQIAAMVYPGQNENQAARALVEGGTFHIYHQDAADFLNGLGINPEGKEYTGEQSWELYINLLSREIVALVEGK